MPNYTLRMLLNDEVIGSETFTAPSDCQAIQRVIGHTPRHDLDLTTSSRIVAERREGVWSLEPSDHRHLEPLQFGPASWANHLSTASRPKAGQTPTG